MGLRFRKIISLGGLLRLNISKTSIGVGMGPKGFSLSIGSKGVRRSVGIPGSGLSYQDATSWKKLNEASDTPTEGINSNACDEAGSSTNSGSCINPWKIAFGLLVGVIFIWYLITPKQKVITETKVLPASAPIPNHPLIPTEIKELQTLLNQKGYKAGLPDGMVGPKTRAAVKSYFKTKNSSQVANFDLKLLNQIRTQ